MKTPIQNLFPGLASLALLTLGTRFSTAWAQGGAWSTRAPVPVARAGSAAGVINGKLYVVGGTGSGAIYQSPPYHRLTDLEVYDPLADAWNTKAPIPIGIDGATAGVINGKLYVAGGQTGWELAGPPGNLANLQVYNPLTDTWTNLSPMPFGSSATCGGVINGKLYVAGGTTTDNLGMVNTLRVYDPATDTWSTKTPMPEAHEWAGAGVLNGILYVVGKNTLEAYDPVKDSWTTKSPMPTIRDQLAAEVINGILYAVGGENGGTNLNTVQAYNPATDLWTTMPPMPTARYSPALGVVNGVLYAVGGGNSNADGQAVNEAFTPFNVDIKMFAGVIVSGPLGSNILIQATANLASSNWTTLTNLALPAQPYIYIDYGSPTNRQQFYRAILQ
ncbi:MAG TPA: kelch repeat-containing protein [Candidatus Binatia bacterium]|jgi:N-acetylneuraminic acid mutarotase|nr:kelch repeat-containing protein [Candidatus Binatia bacterium]